MRGLRFLDFDLMFKRMTDGYRVQVDSPAGQATSEFALPFSDLEIENFLLRFGRPPQATRRFGNTQIEAARTFGGRLFSAVFNGEVRSCLRSSIDDADRQDAGLRIRLRLVDTPELNDLPWEFLLYPERERFLALSAETPIVRYLDLPERIRPLAVKPPFNVLTVISSPTDYNALDIEIEWRKLQESLADLQERGILNLSRLESPTLPHLQRWLRRETCHILHFIGHGGFNPETEDGLLLFSDEKGRGREVTGQTLGTLLHDHRPLRLAVLNACEGARTSRTDPFAGVAQSLVQQGIPAVVAMQFEISDKAAITFAYEFYTAVVDGYPIDAALAEARKALFFAGHELEWGTPVLYMRSPDGRVFDIEPTAVPAIIIKAREPASAQSEPIEARPAPVEVKSALAAPKVQSAETAAKALPTEPVSAAAVDRITVDPITAEPVAIESRPAPFEVKPLLPPAMLKAQDQLQIQPVQHIETKARTEKASLLTASQEQSRPRWAPAVVAWLGLAALLVIALFVAIRLISGSGESDGQIPAHSSAAPRRSSPVVKREAGVYLTKRVKSGQRTGGNMLEAVAGESLDSSGSPTLNDVLSDDICFATDFDRGHKVVWDDLARCKQGPLQRSP